MRSTKSVRRKTGPRAPLLLVLPAALVGLVVLIPLFYLVIRAAQAGGSFLDLLLRPRTLQVLVNTVLLSGAVTAGSIAIAVPLGWLLVRTDLPGRKFWSAASVVPLAVPSLVGGFTFVAAFGAGGIIHQWIRSVMPSATIPNIYGFWGACILLIFHSYPYVLLQVRSALKGLDPAQEEAAQSLGHSSVSIFWRVIMPALRPAILSGSLLVALYTLSDFAAVSLLQFDSFTRAIFVQYQASLNRNYAAVLSLVLVALTGGILFLESMVRGKAVYYRSGTGAKRKPKLTRLGHWRWPALMACSLLVLTSVGLPVGVTLYWLIRGITQGQEILWQWAPILNSVGISLAAAFVTVAAAAPIAVLSVRYRTPLAAALERAAYLGYALPGVVIALAMVFFGARYAGPLYQTSAMLLLAYAVLFLPQALGALRGSLLQVSPNIENLARSLGYSQGKTWVKVVLPIVWPGVLSGASLVFLTAMKELPATLLLSPIGFRTLTTSIWSSVTEAFYARAALPALLLVAVSSFSISLILRGEEERE